jgi:hypothetical protein
MRLDSGFVGADKLWSDKPECQNDSDKSNRCFSEKKISNEIKTEFNQKTEIDDFGAYKF